MFKRPDDLNIISIDPSSRSTGICFCLKGKISTMVVQRKESRMELLGWYLKYFSAMAKSRTWDLVIIEGYAMGGSGRLTMLAEVGGIIRACFSAYKVPILELAPQTWRSVTGVRLKKLSVADKSAYREATYNVLGVSADTVDECDALLFLYTVIQCSKGLVKKGVGSAVRMFLEENKIILENKEP